MDALSSCVKETAVMVGVNDTLQLGSTSELEKTCPPVESETFSLTSINVQNKNDNESVNTQENTTSPSSSEGSSCNVLQLGLNSEPIKATQPAKTETCLYTPITVQTKNEVIKTQECRDSIPSSGNGSCNASQCSPTSEPQKTSPPAEACSLTPVLVQTTDGFRSIKEYRDSGFSFENDSSDSDLDSSTTSSSSSSSTVLLVDGENAECLDIHLDDVNENEDSVLDMHQNLDEKTPVGNSNENDGGRDGGGDDDDDDDDDLILIPDFDEPQYDKKSDCQKLKTKDEVLLEELPAVEDLFISVPEDVELKPIGVVSSILSQLVIVESVENTPALNEDSIIFREDRHAVGKVFEIFGPVRHPYYVIRFNDESHIQSKGLQTRETMYFAPAVKDFTQYIFAEKLKERGSDASWKNDQEPPPEALDYSDDEKEKEAKQKKKKKPSKKNREMDQVNLDKSGGCGRKRGHFQNAPRNVFSGRFQSTRSDFPFSEQRFFHPSHRNFRTPQCPSFSADHSKTLPQRFGPPGGSLPVGVLKSWPPTDNCQNNSGLMMNPPVFSPNRTSFQNNSGMQFSPPGLCSPSNSNCQNNSGLPMNTSVFSPHSTSFQNNHGMQAIPPGFCLPSKDSYQINSGLPMSPPMFPPHGISFQNNPGVQASPPGFCPLKDNCQNNSRFPMNPPVFAPHNSSFQSNFGMQVSPLGLCPPSNDGCQNNAGFPMNPPVFHPPSTSFQNDSGMQVSPSRFYPPSNMAAPNPNVFTNPVNPSNICSSLPSGSNQIFPFPPASTPPPAFPPPAFMQPFAGTVNWSGSNICQQPYTQNSTFLQPPPNPPFSSPSDPSLPNFGSDSDWRNPPCGPC
ncbi:H/ACA ribonucleoprotein complex non-core subunit NAF1 [Protopterus annectens]|uniref:H/ACA ribonucleoprotein complex non-core subunit NAF1 n=1 Tax=Protopterus annectens TaxID=7888 RepID=UPI001CF94A30|nr:H/ACA ribonucleoprotein complex non-core subunit NAF1 [Protopterus annectens]XP_043918155.1 H/ACA ribonucleoprotein complex non-core subunit NAF1 [Protopterus annectens]